MKFEPHHCGFCLHSSPSPKYGRGFQVCMIHPDDSEDGYELCGWVRQRSNIIPLGGERGDFCPDHTPIATAQWADTGER